MQKSENENVCLATKHAMHILGIYALFHYNYLQASKNLVKQSL